MAEISSGKLIVKETDPNDETVVGVQNSYNQKVIDRIKNFITYDENNLPHFTGTANAGVNSPGWVAFENPVAIPCEEEYGENGQLGNRNDISGLNITDTIVEAASLWNTLVQFVQILNRIRPFNSIWYHHVEGSSYQVDSISGTGFFKNVLPVMPSTSLSWYNPTKSWERNGEETVDPLSPTSPVRMMKDQIAYAVDINTAIDNCYNEWMDKCFNKNGLMYTLYTCHLNCHSNCHNSRSRR